MKKEEISGIVVYVLLLALALVFALLVVREYFYEAHLDIGLYILFILGSFVGGLIFNAIIYELAHMLGAKLGRYKVTSVNILGLCFYKKDGKSKVKLAGFDGLSGETKILPKENTKKKPNPRPYCLFGTVFYAIEIIAVIFAYSFLQSTSDSIALKNLSFGLLVAGVVGGGMLLYNIIPFHLDSMTDGYRLILLSNKKNRDAFNDLLTVQNSDNTEKVQATLEKNKGEEQMNAFSADIRVNEIYTLLEKEDFLGAEKIVDDVLSHPNKKMSQKTYLEAKSQKIYLVIMTRVEKEVLEFYDKEVSLQERKAISDDKNFSSIRAYILMAGLLDKSRSECFLTLSRVYKIYKHIPESKKKIEAHLYNLAINKIDAAHPGWNIKEYLIKE